ncbi:hypothetical protein Plhal710r2_c032g0118051 [Plasmopara halstedii]
MDSLIRYRLIIWLKCLVDNSPFGGRIGGVHDDCWTLTKADCRYLIENFWYHID